MLSEQQLLAELAALRAEVQGLRDKVSSLELENAKLSENQIIQLRQIKQLQESTRKKPQPLQKTGLISYGLSLRPMVGR